MSRVQPRDRVAIHSMVRPSSRDTLEAFCDEHSISINSWVEAHIVDLAAAMTEAGGSMNVKADIVACARAIDASRRKRARTNRRVA